MADVWVSVEAVAIVVLVLVTMYYAWATDRIVKETVKDRKIRRLEKGLERFYYPLLKLQEVGKYPYPPSAELNVAEVYVYKMEAIERFWDDITRFQYLSRSMAVRLYLREFQKLSGVHGEESSVVSSVRKARKRLIDQVFKDIGQCEKELSKLHGGEVKPSLVVKDVKFVYDDK